MAFVPLLTLGKQGLAVRGLCVPVGCAVLQGTLWVHTHHVPSADIPPDRYCTSRDLLTSRGVRKDRDACAYTKSMHV